MSSPPRLEELEVEIGREVDGRWIGKVEAIPGVLVYGVSPEDAAKKALALAAEVLADRAEHGER